jgi:transposase-like protein
MGRRYYSPTTRQRAIALVLEDRLSVTQAAREIGCSPITINNWIGKYRSTGHPPTEQASFLPINIIDSSTPTAELVPPNGITIRLTDTSSQYFAELLHALVPSAGASTPTFRKQDNGVGGVHSAVPSIPSGPNDQISNDLPSRPGLMCWYSFPQKGLEKLTGKKYRDLARKPGEKDRPVRQPKRPFGLRLWIVISNSPPDSVFCRVLSFDF